MVEKRTLSNGIRLVYEHIPYVRSVSLGIWIGNGSRHEKASEGGASHFIEHMLFKGTKTYTAAGLAELCDRIGGMINAYTTKDCTCLYGRVLDTQLLTLSDMFLDMLENSNFSEDDVISERSVILDEISMCSDTPDDLVYERLVAGIYKGSSLSRPILGKKSTLDKMTGESLKSFMASHYDPKNIVIAISGNFNVSDIDSIAESFSVMRGNSVKYKKAVYSPYFTVKRRNLEQNHLFVAYPGIPSEDKRKYAFTLLGNIAGGNASSRLFQSVREKYGLCYNICTAVSAFPDTGIFGIYTALSEEAEDKALSVITDEIRKIKDGDITQDELDLSIELVRSGILMSLESTGSRMNRLGRNELYLGYIPSVEEVIAGYERVTLDDITALANEVFDTEQISFSAIGRVRSADEYKNVLIN